MGFGAMRGDVCSERGKSDVGLLWTSECGRNVTDVWRLCQMNGFSCSYEEPDLSASAKGRFYRTLAYIPGMRYPYHTTVFLQHILRPSKPRNQRMTSARWHIHRAGMTIPSP
jgi:hypothetical protein